MLDYVGYSLDDLRDAYKAKVEAAELGRAERRQLLDALEAA
jgi:arginine decarboxylase